MISLEEYINLRKGELESFYGHWLAQHQEDPDNWPLEMNYPDWSEQETIINGI